MLQNLCQIWGKLYLLVGFGLYLVVLLAFAAAFIYFVVDALRDNRVRWKLLYRLTIVITGGVSMFSAFVLVSIIFFLLFFKDDAPPSKDFHNLNAAVKNTCFLDPLRQHCPRSVQELLSIESEHFVPQTRNSVLTYQYYPESNTYTLIVRNKDIRENNNRVVIFDPRFATNESYEKSARFGTGLDFVDAAASQCGGKIRLINIPPFPGPWDEIN